MRHLALILALIPALCLLPAVAPAQGDGAPAAPVALHGSIAASWYHFDDLTDSGLDYDRPTMRLNLKATGLFGGHYSARVRLRSRYNDRARAIGTAPATEWRNRIYEVNLTYDNRDTPFGFQAGRIIARDLGAVGYTDGVLLTHRVGENWRWGALAGTRPDWETSEFQTTVQKYGAFVGFERGDRAESRFVMKLAAIGEYHDSTVSREFLYVRSSYHRERRLDLYGTAELDVNRDWREDRTGESVSLSALYLRARYRATEDVAVGLGYDTRKNYYTYELRSLPDSLFIDAARHGARASVDAKLPGDFRLHADFGMRGIEESGDDPTYSYSAEFTKRDLLGSRIRASLRVSGFSSPYALGTNPSLRLTRSFRGGHSVHASYGLYAYGIESGGADRLNQWLRAGGQTQLPSRLYLSAEYQYDWGDDSGGHRLFGEMGYRF
jgi:hypothetical protein